MQGRGETVIEPRTHLEPRSGRGRALQRAAGAGSAAGSTWPGVKVIGDFVENYRQDLPSELGLLCLFDPRTGAPVAVLDGSGITEVRTGAMTAVGAKYLARPGARALGHVGARGTRVLERAAAGLAVRLRGDPGALAPARQPGGLRSAAVARPRQGGRGDGRLAVLRRRTPTSSWRHPASLAPQPLLRTEWIKPGALVIPYGTMSAVELSLTDIMSKVVVDDWGQCATGKFGALRAHVEAG